MLIEKNTLPAINDIVTIKLTSGEEIVGKLLKVGESAITLGKPVTVALQPMNQKQMGLAFMPTLGSVEPDTTLQFPDSAIAVRPIKTGKAVLSNYIEMTSGLVTAGASSLII